jgi:DNA-binding response OmpR family regulator
MEKPLALIVEDEFDVSVILAKAVEHAGYRTEILRSGDAAMAWLSFAKPDLVVLDLNLPRVLGSDILRRIRAEPRLAGVYVIVATAYQHLGEDVREQADQVLSKPVGFRHLVNLVSNVRTLSVG